jgi:hypothetical protein
MQIALVSSSEWDHRREDDNPPVWSSVDTDDDRNLEGRLTHFFTFVKIK